MSVPYEPGSLPPHSRGLNAITGAMCLIVVLLMVQIWLLSATLDSYLANRHHVALPAAVISALMCACCLGLYLFIRGIDNEVRKMR